MAINHSSIDDECTIQVGSDNAFEGSMCAGRWKTVEPSRLITASTPARIRPTSCVDALLSSTPFSVYDLL